MGREDLLLQVSSQLEAARPWRDHYKQLDPVLAAGSEPGVATRG
jgi:hypothetical protein